MEKFIEREDLDSFKQRIIETIHSIPIDIIDRTIQSLPKRVEMVIKSKGDRIKY